MHRLRRNEIEAMRAGGAHRSDAPYHNAPSVGRAVLCTPFEKSERRRVPNLLRSGQAYLPTRHVSSATTISVRFCLCLNDIGIGTCIAVKCSDPVVIERIGSQAGHTSTSPIHSEIVIPRYVSAKGATGRDV